MNFIYKLLKNSNLHKIDGNFNKMTIGVTPEMTGNPLNEGRSEEQIARVAKLTQRHGIKKMDQWDWRSLKECLSRFYSKTKGELWSAMRTPFHDLPL